MTIDPQITSEALDTLISDYTAASSRLSHTTHELERAHQVIWALVHRQGGEVFLTMNELDRADVLDFMLAPLHDGIIIRSSYQNSTVATWPTNDDDAVTHAQDELGGY